MEGRSRKGYGLPSLVVVLFFVGTIIQAVVHQTAIDHSEAKAETAFVIAKESIDTFKATNELPASLDLPHLHGASRYITITKDSSAGDELQIVFVDDDRRAAALFEQKIRSYTNVPVGNRVLTRNVRREYPERILRSGDWMATDLETTGISGAADITTGTLKATAADTSILAGGPDTRLTAARYIAPTGSDIISELVVVDDITADTMSVGASLSTGDITSSNNIDIQGHGQATEVTAPFVNLFATFRLVVGDEFQNVDDLIFMTLNIHEATVTTLETENYNAGETHGGSPKTGPAP